MLYFFITQHSSPAASPSKNFDKKNLEGKQWYLKRQCFEGRVLEALTKRNEPKTFSLPKLIRENLRVSSDVIGQHGGHLNTGHVCTW